MLPSTSRKQSFLKRFNALVSERSSFISLWQELSDYHLAHRGRFLVSDRNKGHKRNTKQINNTSRRAVRTLASGMMAGITSPARPWFRLAIPDPVIMEIGEVRMWLMSVERILREIFSVSNLYNSLHSLYAELGTFGVGSMGIYEDFENVIRCKTYTVGSYCLATNGKDQVDTWVREYQLTVGQLVKEFGIDNCSHGVQQNWRNGNTEIWVDVIHMIEPNDDRDRMNPLAKHKRFRSVYFEKAKGKGQDTFLRESGFDEFPNVSPRWDVTCEDVYSNCCPGIDALGDTKALQLAEQMKYTAIEKHVDPHMIAPDSMRHAVEGGLLSGEITFVTAGSVGQKLEPVYQVNPNLTYHNEDIAKVEDRINQTFYVDLFLMLANSNRRQITAREVAERHEEKLLMLGPVLERLHNELLDPLIDRTFNIAQRAGILPPPPEVLQGREVRVQYISVLAQAQQMVAVGGIERLGGYVAQLTNIWPESRHKFDAAQSIDQYADALGVSPDLIVPDEEYDQLVAAEREQVAAAQQQVAMPEMAGAAKDISQVDTGGKNAMTDLLAMAGVGGSL